MTNNEWDSKERRTAASKGAPVGPRRVGQEVTRRCHVLFGSLRRVAGRLQHWRFANGGQPPKLGTAGSPHLCVACAIASRSPAVTEKRRSIRRDLVHWTRRCRKRPSRRKEKKGRRRRG